MKKFIVLTIVMLALVVSAFCQELVESIEDITANIPLSDYLISLTSTAVAVPLVVQFIKKYIKLEGQWTQIMSWIVSVLIVLSASLLKVGMYASITMETWYLIPIYGISVGLVANGIVSSDKIKELLNILLKGKQ